MNKLPIAGPWITEKEVSYVAEAARTAWYAGANSFNQRFEQAFAEYIGVKFAVSLPHCTAAIHLALAALGVGEGDEVILPDVTWIASAAPVSYVGATPVFADIDPATWCLSADAFERSITPRTKAVIPVDLYGNLPDWAEIRAVADRHGIAVIEDSAEALGSEYHGSRAGSLGDVGVFSFHGSKTLTTGEGGMLVTDRVEVRDRVLVLRDHGRPPGDRFFCNTEIAFKYKMSAMQAALGLAQIERIEELVGRKREIYSWYRDELKDVAGLTLNPEPPGTINSYWMSTVIVDAGYNIEKRRLMELLDERGIDTRPFFNPLSSLPAYANSPGVEKARINNKSSYSIAPRGLNLPSALSLTRDDIARVAAALRSVLGTLL